MLRTPDGGADTVVWLALSKAALDQANGQFYLDRKAQSLHLTFAATKSSEEEHQQLMTSLDEIAEQFKTTSST
ncbi:putative dehydrogenase/reductase SDR family member 12 [Apostichopus japonicus]|uniref:Putative dehydrogenase/reductase SDR family member 12 n=2 Tax=Stichopus japonicus TaxID=307972 RepID=A0A2G8JY10_STIJA|nr:putative dehydrogenase/reductase SDR family member 12 [Apostichopus japonicus]